MTTRLVTTNAELDILVAEVQGQEFLAVDTEFIRERTYYPRLCLIQLATPTTAACVDTIAVTDLEPLLSVLLDPTITKVLHAARQDLEIFVQLTGTVPGPVFDTQIASDLCGLGDQGGLAAVAAQLLDVEIDKSHTRTDWSRRPLSTQQLKYAMDDASYLVPIYKKLRARLQESDRAAWLEAECEKLTDPALYTVDPETAWQRLRGLGALSKQQFHAARLLARWREKRAMELDRPRGWVLRDDVLLRVAADLPADENSLERIKGFPRPLLKQTPFLLELIDKAVNCEDESPDLPDMLSNEQRKLVGRLMAMVRETATETGISAATLATRRDVTAIVQGRNDASPLHGWRQEIIGNRLLAVVSSG
ncbi:MAG: ribonuclease D [Gammaproteobacteria bacterium]|nr:ribonuclease D [Gammaproteobacteria bacterium]